MGKTVLIVDDDAGIRRAFARILQRSGYTTDLAQNSKEALQKSTANRYDVVLVDISLPDGNGLELLNQMHRLNKEMVTIVITGDHIAFDKNTYVDAFFLKPVKPNELLETIEQKTAEKQAK